MNSKLPKAIITAIVGFLASFLLATPAFAAPNLQFSPSAVSTQTGGTFDVSVNINTDGQQAWGGTSSISFSSTDLTATSVTNGSFFPMVQSSIGNGTVTINSRTSDYNLNDTRSGTGTLAVIHFKFNKTSGSAPITFNCGGSGNDTFILNSAGQNILTCANVNSANVTYSAGGSGSTPTPTPTLTPTPTTTQNQGGVNQPPTCTGLNANPSASNATPLTVTFLCSGVDPSGDITGAQFTFGDGTSETVYKNVGSPGSISVTHTYNQIGSLGAKCIVRDNDNAWSNESSACKQIIVINPTSQRTTVLTNPNVVVRTNPTPTPLVIGGDETPVFDTPTPTPEEVITPEPTAAPVESASSGLPWWLIGAIALIVIGLIIYLFTRKKHPPTPPPWMNSTPVGPPPYVPPAAPPTPTVPPTSYPPIEETPIITPQPAGQSLRPEAPAGSPLGGATPPPYNG